MKKIICGVMALVFLTACNQFKEPDVTELSQDVISGQTLEDMNSADASEVGIIFDIDQSLIEDFSVLYSGRGGYADILAIFKLYDKSETETVEDILEHYREDRYNDFLGYAPFEAKKIENGKVLTYGRYVILAVLPDIDTAVETIDSAFRG